MQNKKILYILTFIITLFTFNINVNAAAQELTCVYKKGSQTDKIILIQDSKGNRELWTNSQDANMDSSGWEKDKYEIDLTRVNSANFDKSNNLKVCPAYTNAPVTNNGPAIFFDEKNILDLDKWFPQELDENNSKKEVERPTTAQVVDPDIEVNREEYQGTCKYMGDLSTGKKHYVTVNFGKDQSGISYISVSEEDPEKGKYSGELHKEYIEYIEIDSPIKTDIVVEKRHSYKFEVSTAFTAEYFMQYSETFSGQCPPAITVDRDINYDTHPLVEDSPMLGKYQNVQIHTTLYTTKEARKGDTYIIDSAEGTSPITDEELNTNGPNLNIIFEEIDVKNCEELLGTEITGYLNGAWNIVKFGVPILLIVLGTIDFVQVIFAGKDDAMKKAQDKFIKRVIIAVAIFLVPSIIGFLLNIANGIWPSIGTDICGILF